MGGYTGNHMGGMCMQEEEGIERKRKGRSQRPGGEEEGKLKVESRKGIGTRWGEGFPDGKENREGERGRKTDTKSEKTVPVNTL